MSNARLFMDTGFAIAFLNKRDQHAAKARALAPRLSKAKEVWTTEAILTEIGNALSARDRAAAAHFIRQCYQLDRFRVVVVDTKLLTRALDLYESRSDKEWGLTDCISFIVMRDQGLSEALAYDQHFRQAGFHPLMSA